MDISYIIPIKRRELDRPAFAELVGYLATLGVGDPIIVDGSPPGIFAAHHSLVPDGVRHLSVDPSMRARNGKVAGVLTGLYAARYDQLVIADDDVRYDRWALLQMRRLLGEADVVRPQNYFDPLPWHARVDTARTLLNRALDGDWPGTFGVRRSMLLRTGGYDGDVLFENLEMVRTIRAAGGRERVARNLFVRRLPPTVRHFWSQRVRQAYDEFARPPRLATALAVFPALIVVPDRYRRSAAIALATATMAFAEYGRRRDGGSRVFPFSATLLAPVWLTERAVCAWLAVAVRALRGGIAYSGNRIARSATPLHVLRKRSA